MTTVLRKLPTIARILLGLVFLVFGLNGFLQFLPMPPMPEAAGAYFGALTSAQVLPIVKAIEVVAGFLLLTGLFVALALLLLAPIVVNIVLFHAVVTGEGLPVPLVLVALGIYLAWAYRDSFRGVLQARAQPRVADEPAPAGVVSRSVA